MNDMDGESGQQAAIENILAGYQLVVTCGGAR
jgi:hypothetical protein